MEQVKLKYDNETILQIDWTKKKIVKNSLASGIRYATYSDNKFYGWLKRSEVTK